MEFFPFSYTYFLQYLGKINKQKIYILKAYIILCRAYNNTRTKYLYVFRSEKNKRKEKNVTRKIDEKLKMVEKLY